MHIYIFTLLERIQSLFSTFISLLLVQMDPLAHLCPQISLAQAVAWLIKKRSVDKIVLYLKLQVPLGGNAQNNNNTTQPRQIMSCECTKPDYKWMPRSSLFVMFLRTVRGSQAKLYNQFLPSEKKFNN